LFKHLTRLDLVLIVVAATLSAFAGAMPSPLSHWLQTGSVLLLLATLVVEWASRWSRPERRWFGGRFIAESVKSVA
jgi:hypothetical protein